MQGHPLGDPPYFHCCVEAGSFGGVAPATNAGRLIPCCANWAKRAGHRTPTSWFSKSHLWRGSAKVVARVVPSLYMAFLWAWEAVPLSSKKEVHPWTALLVHNSETSDEVLKSACAGLFCSHFLSYAYTEPITVGYSSTLGPAWPCTWPERSWFSPMPSVYPRLQACTLLC